MKMSEVGNQKILDNLTEFEQSDFRDADVIVLSVDDAEEIVQYLWDTVGMISVSRKRGKAIDGFIKKVWQAKATVTKEMCDEDE